MKTWKVVATFPVAVLKPVGDKYTKEFGPFTEIRAAESCLVQISGQASCQGAEVVEAEES